MIAVAWAQPPVPAAPQAERIISKFGGLTALARALRHKHPTTVQGWKERGFIPAWQMPGVMAAAKELGIELTLEDILGEAA